MRKKQVCGRLGSSAWQQAVKVPWDHPGIGKHVVWVSPSLECRRTAGVP